MYNYSQRFKGIMKYLLVVLMSLPPSSGDEFGSIKLSKISANVRQDKALGVQSLVKQANSLKATNFRRL